MAAGELNQAISQNIAEQALLGIHTGFPGVIREFDDTSLTATVEPGFKYVENELQPDGSIKETVKSWPLIRDVPVCLPVFGEFQIRPPASQMQGARVWCNVAERSIDNFMESGEPCDPEESRFLDITDCVVTGGICPDGQAPARQSDPDSLEISYKSSVIEISAEGKFRIRSGKNDFFKSLSGFLDNFQNMMVMDPSAGPLSLTTVSKKIITDFKDQVDNMRIKP